ncbi:hypothetical protein B0T25DRAFT_599561 [Lasiosphaeria hispida]|uniref:Uncharacterized protein n=1 Tax=Lasiosphaeria hispida TaxID=260671 RepID=A0AAJ0HNV5_9PEZI|nr:hypothetical protein B0T25DRAFT_599561 [Lasiosphaeria hispida]
MQPSATRRVFREDFSGLAHLVPALGRRFGVMERAAPRARSRREKLALASSLGFGYCAGAVIIYKCTTLLLHLQDFTYAVDGVQLFGSATLGGYTPANSGGQKHTGDGNPAVTIGSYPMNKRRRVSQFDTIDEPDSMSF